MGHLNVESLLRASCKILPAILFVKDRECRYVYCSKTMPNLNHDPEDTILGKTDLEIQPDPQLGMQFYLQDLQILDTGLPFSCISQYQVGGQTVYCEISRRPVYDDSGNITGVSGIVTAVTQLTKLRQHFQKLSLHDCLTGVYNRNYVVEYDFDNEENLPCSCILCDCNDLKRVNDTSGHEEGDRYIRGISKAISDAVEDNGIVIRWGGDEFLTIVPRCDEQQCKQYVERINRNQETLRKDLPYARGARGALGWVTRTHLSQPEPEMIELADLHMYKNKQPDKTAVFPLH